MIKVVLLGAGNLGTHLFRALRDAENISLVQWYNRSSPSLEAGKNHLQTTTDLNQIVEADVYLLSVSDSVLLKLGQVLEERNGLVAHTAGSVPMRALAANKNHGVFYPLQTFSKQKQVDFHQIPICVEANTDRNLTLLKSIATALGGPIHLIDSSQRKALHVAAVFVNNFVNHLYSIGHSICQEKEVPFSILQPLIQETADKVLSLSPREAQTGPALRNDATTVNQHLEQLTTEHQKLLYQSLTNSIQLYHGH